MIHSRLKKWWQALVRVLGKDERADEALARVEAALAADEAPPELHALAAQLHAALGNDEAAEAALRTYVERSDSAAAYLPLVNFHSTHADAEATIATLDAALARFPDEASLRLQRTEANRYTTSRKRKKIPAPRPIAAASPCTANAP